MAEAVTEDDANKTTNARDGGEKVTLRSVWHHTRADPVYKHRVIHTAIVCWSFVGLGWAVGISGTTFPDIRLIIGEELGKSSFLFTGGSVGYLVGSLVGGVLYDKFNKLLLLALSSFGLGVVTLVTPYCATFALMIIAKFAGGVLCGGLDAGGNADILHVWGSNSGPFMQALHFGFSFGALLSPMAAEPFLAKQITVCRENVSEHIVPTPNITGRILYLNTTNEYMYTDPMITQKNLWSNLPQNKLQTSTASSVHINSSVLPDSCYHTYEETRVHFAFLITALVIFSSTLGFLYVHLRLKCSNAATTDEIDEAVQSTRAADQQKRHQLSKALTVIFLILLDVLLCMYCVFEDCFTTFFMTFSLEYLNWGKKKGAFGTAAVWTAFGLGRFCGIFTVTCCTSTVMLITYFCMLSVGFIGFLVSSSVLLEPLIWISMVIIGFSSSVIFPAIFSFTSEHVIHVSGKISAIFLVTASLGSITFPLLIGNLMDYVHPMWFVYVLACVLGFCVLDFLLIHCLVKCLVEKENIKQKHEKDHVATETEMKLMQT